MCTNEQGALKNYRDTRFLSSNFLRASLVARGPHRFVFGGLMLRLSIVTKRWAGLIEHS